MRSAMGNGRAGVHVLLHDGEQVHVQVLGRGQDGAQLRNAVRRFAHHTALDGGAERHPVLDHIGEDLRVDLLEVEIADALAVGLDQLDAVAAAVGVVAGVQAEVDQLGVGGVEEPLDMVLGVDVRVGVRMYDEFEAVGLLDLVAEPFHALGQVRPLLGRQLLRLEDLRGLVVPPEGGDDDQVPRAHRLGERGHLADVGPGLVPDGRPPVHAGEDRTGRHLQVPPPQLVRQPGRSVVANT